MKNFKKRKSTTALYKAQTKYYSAIESPDKVLQRGTKPPQDIVVYLKSPRRSREKANILQTFRKII